MTNHFQIFCKRILIVIITLFKYINSNNYLKDAEGYTTIPNDIGNGITYISISFNPISHIGDDSFDETSTDFSTVLHLRLEKNRIETFSERALLGFDELSVLRLNGNRIHNVVFNVEIIPKLEQLEIKNNRLNQLPTFYGIFTSLKRLYLSENLILRIRGNDFQNITNIQELRLSNNRLISFKPIQELASLTTFLLDNNNLVEIPTLKGTYKSLQTLNLHNNNISLGSVLMLRERINGSEQSLNTLTLGGNKDFPKNFTAVVNFLAEYQKLSEVSFADLEINNMSDLLKKLFKNSNLPDDLTLTLDRNPLEVLPNLYKLMISSNVNGIVISLRETKFNCDKLCWMTQGMRQVY